MGHCFSISRMVVGSSLIILAPELVVFKTKETLACVLTGNMHSCIGQKLQHSDILFRFKTTWEYADVSKRGWQWSYDYDAEMVCARDGCSVTKCGHRATCTDIGGEGSCSCDIGFDGNPYKRCYPIEVPNECSCTKLSVTSTGIEMSFFFIHQTIYDWSGVINYMLPLIK